MSGWVLMMAMGAIAAIGAAVATWLVGWLRPQWSRGGKAIGGLALLIVAVILGAVALSVGLTAYLGPPPAGVPDDPGSMLVGIVFIAATVQVTLCVVVGLPIALSVAGRPGRRTG